jgi:hypothetical protein
VADEPGEAGVPPFPPEGHVCLACGVDYQRIGVDAALPLIAAAPQDVRAAVAAVPTAALRGRPQPGRWSVVEYVCHLRDVHAVYTIRLHRARTECRPVLEPMLNDLRARRFRYDRLDLAAVLDEFAANTLGLLDEIARFRPGDWTRMVTRLPGEERTARWLVRQVVHEDRHHVADIRAAAPTG